LPAITSVLRFVTRPSALMNGRTKVFPSAPLAGGRSSGIHAFRVR
jgi:hypothetical protein